MADVQVSQLVGLAAKEALSSAEVSEVIGLVAIDDPPSSRVDVSEIVALVAIGDPPSRWADVSEIVGLVSYTKDQPVTQVSEIIGLVSYVSSPPETYNSRAWGFTFDQHPMYVLHLGQQGTFVYDLLAQQWYQWQTQGYNNWNMENGVEWNGQVFAGDSQTGDLWRLDEDGFLDEDFKLIKRIVTAGVTAEARNTVSSGMLVLSMSPEGELDTLSDPYVRLDISDDDGKTYAELETIALTGDETQDISWRGLGLIRYPGRVFRITDEGGMVRINGANLTTRPEKKGRG